MDYEKADGSKPTKTEKAQFLVMTEELQKLQDIMDEHWVDVSIPDEWNGLDTETPLVPDRKKITMQIDTEIYKFFRKLGPGYQKRINQVLRIYVSGVLSGRIARGHDGLKPVFQMDRARDRAGGI